MSYKIGIDVGGTNTDAVLLDERNNLLGAAKTPTTVDVATGIFNSVDEVLRQAHVDPVATCHVMLGTTACTNAIVERKNLARIGMVRIALPAAAGVEPMFTWDDDLKRAVGGLWFQIHGGYEFDGSLIDRDLDPGEVEAVAARLKAEGVEAVAITGVFSPVRADQERRLADRLREVLGPEVAITLSHEIGSTGLLDRENSAGLNAALVKVAREAVGGLERALRERGIRAFIFFAQNDGTLMDLDFVRRYPILTIGSGPTNSIRGAAYLSGLSECLVVDVGGTTTDIGALSRGFPRQSGVAVEIGHVRTNFRMPDILSIGLGGGSIVRNTEGRVTVGPDSVGYRLTEKSIGFGGDSLTTTDAAVRAGYAQIHHPAFDHARLRTISDRTAAEVLRQITAMTETGIDKMKTSAKDLPVVLVGGGSILLPERLKGASAVIRPLHSQYANAIGAAIAQVSGEIDRIWPLEQTNRQQAVAEAKAEATRMAVRAGADPETVAIVDLEDVPLAYLPSNALRIRAKAVGALRVDARVVIAGD